MVYPVQKKKINKKQKKKSGGSVWGGSDVIESICALFQI